MGEDVPVRPDQVSLGVLVTAVPRDAVDAAVAACGVGAKRSDGKLPAHVTAYLTMALCLFADDYEEVATKVTGSLSRWGCWDAGWSVAVGGNRWVRGRPTGHAGQRRGVRLCRVRGQPVCVPQSAGGGVGRVRHARVFGRRGRRI